MEFVFELFALAVLIISLAAGIVWEHMERAVKPLEERRDQRAEDAQASDFRVKQAAYNDTEHGEFCSELEPFCGEGKRP